MPIFEYRCGACGHRFEELVVRADELVECPRCQSATEKLFSAFAAPVSSAAAPSGACACSASGGG